MLVGAVTVLVVVVAVFLAYNANYGPAVRADDAAQGRPRQRREPRPAATRSAPAASASASISEMEPVALPGGTVGAQLTLKLDRKFGAVPADST